VPLWVDMAMMYCVFCKMAINVISNADGDYCTTCGKKISISKKNTTMGGPFKASIITTNGMPNLNAIYYD
jgi:DNA-directed RNA polymerase subunit RPC12/RpoP